MPETSGTRVFACAPSRHLRSDRKRAKFGPTVDIHCHVHVDQADEIMAPFRRPGQEPILHFASEETVQVNRRSLGGVRDQLGSLDARLADMDAQGIDFQLISPSPFQYFYWGEAEQTRLAAQCVNDWIAANVDAKRERFAGLATVPLQDTSLAVEELERAVCQLGLKGVEIGTSVGHEELSSPRLRPFFARAEELGAYIFIHPNGFTDGSRMAVHNLINLIGNPLETTLAASHLIFGGVMKNMPKLKICLAHGGGFLPMYSGRMDHAHSVRPDCQQVIDELPSTYLKQFYFDTVVYTTAQLEFLVQNYGAERVMMGTDYPYDMGEPDPMGLVCGCEALSDDQKAAIVGGNAISLLNLDVSAAAVPILPKS